MVFVPVALSAREILDSRGRPTLHVQVTFGGGEGGAASVPTGRSRGKREATELRDCDPARFAGAGVLRAVKLIETEIAGLLLGRRWESVADVDKAIIELDGTPDRSSLGANTMIGVSMAFARARAAQLEVPLYRSLFEDRIKPRMPVPHFNVINGGVHAANKLELQEFMVAPLGAHSMSEAVQVGVAVYEALRELLVDAGQSSATGDAGGFAPDIDTPERACDLLVDAIEMAGYEASLDDVAIAIDCAASEYARGDGTYSLGGELLDTDDLLVTNAAAIEDASAHNRATAALIKPNQVGTVTETMAALNACRDAGWGAMVSHRSGDTSDTFIADLAVASGCGQIKAGAPARGERVAKYNRLLEIADELGPIPYGPVR
jgi:enolase